MDQSVQRAWEEIVYFKRQDALSKCVFVFLKLISFLYVFIWRCYLFLYYCGVLKKHRVPAFVVGIGNLTLGGTGKTAFVETLARRWLKEKQNSVCVLTRGYPASPSQPVFVSEESAPEQCGDEAVYLFQKLRPVPVVCCRNRLRSANIVTATGNPSVLFMDDAFQYQKLYKDEEIVLVDATNPFGNGEIFPAGILREPAAALRRANMVVLTKADQVPIEEKNKLLKVILNLAPGIPVFQAKYVPASLFSIREGRDLHLNTLKGWKIAGMCAIGSPESFQKTLESAGAEVVHFFRFPDHHFFTKPELENVQTRCLQESAEALVTTEKDAVRIRTLKGMTENGVPFFVLKVRFEFLDNGEELFWQNIQEAFKKKRRIS